jgi:hypothetical protein
MITLFESVTGNMTFSTDGWEFVWGNSSEYPDPIWYNTETLMQKIYEEAQRYEIGGVPCEPDSIFVICNNYPQNAFLLHQAIHGSSYLSDALLPWRSTIEKRGINRLPYVDGLDNNYFNLDYLIRPLGIWEPIGMPSC